MKFREATPHDWDAIWPVFHEVVAAGETYSIPPDMGEAEAKALWFPDKGRVYVAEEAGEVLATCRLAPNQPGLGDHVANAGFMVAGRARGRGLGRELALLVLERARELGYEAMQFNYVVSSNQAAVNLWLSLGFTIIGTVPRAFRHARLGPVDVHIMHRFL